MKRRRHDLGTAWRRGLLAILLCWLCLAAQSICHAVTNGVQQQEQQQLVDALAQRGRSQLQTATVLDALAAGTIQAHSALSLLQDVSDLRESLVAGAAAARVSTAAARHREKQQQQQQQDAAPTRGILIVAGGANQFKNAYILLKLLAHPDINCRLPVEVVYYGPQEYDSLTAATVVHQLVHAAGLSIKFIDGRGVAPTGETGLEPHKPPGRLTGFKAKVHALVWVTSFDHVIMLDSDNTPLTDPTPLLDSPAFRTHGSILWPDFWSNQWMQPALYSLLGLDTPWESDPAFRACEAGQVVLDRSRHRDVLEYLWLLNSHSNSGIPGAQLGAVGQCLWGDKDTYPIAFQLAGKASDFHSVQHKPLQALSRPGGKHTTRLSHAGMVHRAPWGSGPLMWLHRTAAGKFWPHCKVHGGGPCRVWALTTPVDQQQLLTTVRDPSAMEMGIDQVDLDWWEQHCADSSSSSTSAEGEPGATSTEGGSDHQQGQCSAEEEEGGSCGVGGDDGGYSNATALPCDVDAAAGLLPIPVLRTKRTPAQVKRLLSAAQRVFATSQKIKPGWQGEEEL